MVRIAVTAYLILVALLGPGLCCCTTVRLLPGCSHQGFGSLDKEKDLPASHYRCGCNHQLRHRHPAQQPRGPSDDSPSCPCKDHKTIPVAVLASETQFAKNLVSSLLEPEVDTILPAHPASPSSVFDGFRVSEETPTSAFQTAREILRAFQTMRC